MKILVNAINLRSAGTLVTGKELLAAFARLESPHEFVFVVPAGYGYEDLVTGQRTRVLPQRLPGWWPIWRLWFDFVGLARLFGSLKADALIALTNHAPADVGRHKIVLCRSVFYRTSSDVGPMGRGLRYTLERWLFGFTARTADVLVAQTEHVAEGLHHGWGVPPDRIRIIPNALSTEVRRAAGSVEITSALLPEGMPTDAFVLLYPSRYYGYKNHEVLLEVADVLRRRGRTDIVFVITVDPALGAARTFLGRLSALNRTARAVLNLGEVPQSELNRWYRRADALVFPSLAETFGNALLEAMAWKLPILAADRPYAIDVCGEAALRFPPRDVTALADLCERLADDEDLRREMAERSRRRLETFPTWDDVARAFVELAEDERWSVTEARPGASR